MQNTAFLAMGALAIPGRADADPVPHNHQRGHLQQYPLPQVSTPANSPQSGIPSFGGRVPDGATTVQGNWGVKQVPTPREMVVILNQHVVGQAQAKKILQVQRQ